VPKAYDPSDPAWEIKENWNELKATLTDGEISINMASRFENLQQGHCLKYDFQAMLKRHSQEAPVIMDQEDEELEQTKLVQTPVKSKAPMAKTEEVQQANKKVKLMTAGNKPAAPPPGPAAASCE